MFAYSGIGIRSRVRGLARSRMSRVPFAHSIANQALDLITQHSGIRETMHICKRVLLPVTTTALLASTVLVSTIVNADSNEKSERRPGICAHLPDHATFRDALVAANHKVTADNPGLPLDNQMWGTLVAAEGTICAIASTGNDNLQSQWLASRIISAQKANTANSLSLGNNDGGSNAGLALSSANLWAAVQPGGSLYGLQHSNPVDASRAYKGSSRRFGTRRDPLVGIRIGGINVFGGGLALYAQSGDRTGGVGVSGDTSCRDHMVAWEVRAGLMLDNVTAGVSGDPQRPDNIIFDTENGFGHPNCLAADAETAAAGNLTAVPD